MRRAFLTVRPRQPTWNHSSHSSQQILAAAAARKAKACPEEACTGGGEETIFDIDGDQRVNDSDYINIGTADNPVWAPPTGLKQSGIYYTPAVLSIPGTGTDVLYFSTSGGSVETEFSTGEKLGFHYWRTW